PFAQGTGDHLVPRLTGGHRHGDRVAVPGQLDALVAQQENGAREAFVGDDHVAATGEYQERVGSPYYLRDFGGNGRDDYLVGGPTEPKGGPHGQVTAVRVHATTLSSTLNTTHRRGDCDEEPRQQRVLARRVAH